MIVEYSHDEHYEKLKGWLRYRSLDIPVRELFSDCGFVVDGIAVGFLFKTGSKQAYVDHIAADPDADPVKRDHALTVLIHTLENHARDCGFLMVTTLGKLPVMKKRFERLGYRAHGDYTLYYKVLGGEKCLG